MHRILILNGPNLNLLGRRRPETYGTTTLRELERLCREWGAHLSVGVETFQSNHEGELIDRMHGMHDAASGLVINAGALTHYSYALHDAIEAVGLPTVEVHISNIKAREEWRRHSVIAPACVASIYGRGTDGYHWALKHLMARSAWPFETIRYGPEHDQIGDLRLPEGAGPHPVVVLIHGGFWRDPWQRDLMDGVSLDLTRRGFATWNIEYRRVGAGGGWPATLSDVAAALDHLSRLAHDLPLDLDRTITLGHSAGGHLALWAASRHRLSPDQPGAGPSVRPRAVVALAPMADLIEAQRLGIGDGAVEDFLRRRPDEGPERYRTASPADRLPLGIPQIIVHGTADDRVPHDLGAAYADAAAAAGDPVQFRSVPDADHGQLIDPRDPAWAPIAEVVAELAAS